MSTTEIDFADIEDLKGKDLSQIKTGFTWVVGAKGQPVTFFLDDIRFE